MSAHSLPDTCFGAYRISSPGVDTLMTRGANTIPIAMKENTSAHRVRTGSGSPSKMRPSSADQNGDSAMRRSDRAGSSSNSTSVKPSDNKTLQSTAATKCGGDVNARRTFDG